MWLDPLLWVVVIGVPLFVLGSEWRKEDEGAAGRNFLGDQ